MNNIKKKKIWVTPEIKKITGFNVHENVVATSEEPLESFNNNNNPPPES